MTNSTTTNFALLPGFGLDNTMYSNLDIYENAQAVEVEHSLTWEHCLEYVSGQIDENTILVGYSQGARIALATAIENPQNISGLVIISGNTGISNEDERLARCKADIALAELALTNFNDFWEKFDKNDVFDTPISNEDRINNGEVLSQQLMNLGQGLMPDYGERISEIRVPVLFASGIRDNKYSVLARAMKKKTAFSHHILFDSDHRVVHNTPKNLSLAIEWFSNNVVNR